MKQIVIIMGLLSISSFTAQARTGDVSYEFETMLQSRTIDMNLRVPNSLEEVNSKETHSADGTETRPKQSEQ